MDRLGDRVFDCLAVVLCEREVQNVIARVVIPVQPRLAQFEVVDDPYLMPIAVDSLDRQPRARANLLKFATKFRPRCRVDLLRLHAGNLTSIRYPATPFSIRGCTAPFACELHARSCYG